MKNSVLVRTDKSSTYITCEDGKQIHYDHCRADSGACQALLQRIIQTTLAIRRTYVASLLVYQAKKTGTPLSHCNILGCRPHDLDGLLSFDVYKLTRNVKNKVPSQTIRNFDNAGGK